jgi:hypothetical protein
MRQCSHWGLNADANISECVNAGFAALGVQPGSQHLLGLFMELAVVCGVPAHEAAEVPEIVLSPAARLASTLAEFMEFPILPNTVLARTKYGYAFARRTYSYST